MILDATQLLSGVEHYRVKTKQAIRNYNRAVDRNDRRRSSYWFNEVDRYLRMALKAYGPIVVDEDFYENQPGKAETSKREVPRL